MATYSINNGSTTETTRKTSIDEILRGLPDNTNKLISPRAVRDAFLSTWANSAFKITSIGNGDEYIGLDSGDPDNRDIQKKILIGRRNDNEGNPIMNETLLESDTDIFLYKTSKRDEDIDKTRISILAGDTGSTNSSFPYFEAITEGSQTKSDFNINNEGGIINIKAGDVFINGVRFPDEDTDTNNKILKYVGEYPYGSLKWMTESQAVDNIIGNNQPINVVGNIINLNGYSLEFDDERSVPEKIGGIEQNDSFPLDGFTNSENENQNWPLSEVIRKLLYPFIEPKLELRVFNKDTNDIYFDIGKDYSVDMDYSITTYQREYDERPHEIKLSSDEFADLDLDTSVQYELIKPGDFSTSITQSSITQSSIPQSSSVTRSITFKAKTINKDDGSVKETSISKDIFFISPFIAFLSSRDSYTKNTVIEGYLQDPSTTSGSHHKVLKSYIDEETTIDFILDNDTLNYLYIACPANATTPYGIRPNNSGLTSIDTFIEINESITTEITPYSAYRLYRSKNKMIIGSDIIKLLFSNTENTSNYLLNDFYNYRSTNLDGYTKGITTNTNGFTSNTTRIYISLSSEYSDNETAIGFLKPGSIIRISKPGFFMKYIVNLYGKISLNNTSERYMQFSLTPIVGGNALYLSDNEEIKFEIIVI